MDTTDLTYDKTDGVAYITINRPERRNALGDTTTRQLVTVCEDAAADDSVRVLCITGSGDEAFCSGGDLQDTFQRGVGKTEAQWAERIRQGPNSLAGLLQGIRKPVVASINGVAVGGGATIALACDLRIGADSARFSFPFVRLGITPEFGCSYLLQRTVGLGRANELLLLGGFIDAPTAERYGLLNKVVPRAELKSATKELIDRLLALPAPALARIKALQRFAQTADLPATLEQEALALGASFISPEHRGAVSSFLNRTKPR